MKMMERLIEVPPEPEQGGHCHDMNIMNDVMLENAWTGSSASSNISNNILYIAVEYVKDGQLKIDTEPHQSALSPRETFSEFDQHVSPLDPNMCSVAGGYSPVYVSSDYDTANIMLVSAEDQDNLPITPSQVPQIENRRYIQSGTSISDDSLQIIPEGEQEVSLLIMDQNTGISYSVNAQEYLEDRHLADDQQLLANLAPVALLDSDLLSLDENALKAQLSKIVDPNLRNISTENAEDVLCPPVRPKRTIKSEALGHCEDDLLSCVQVISDKPILSRAKATLPESYLSLRQLDNNEFGVFSRKYIPNRTQFGPLEGIISNEPFKIEQDLVLSIETDKGTFQYLDISNEDYTNWMVFVRKATNYDEQNCVLVQFENNLYYTTIRNVLPKQELLVGYGMMYAKSRNLTVFEPEVKMEPCWPCFECSDTFLTSLALQRHMDCHDPLHIETAYRSKPRNHHKRRKTFAKTSSLECSMCGVRFDESNMKILKDHLRVEHNVSCKDKLTEHCRLLNDRQISSEISIDDFTEQICIEEANLAIEKKKFRCPSCKKSFLNAERLQRHLPIHDSNSLKPVHCPLCPKRFLTHAALLCHAKMHQGSAAPTGNNVTTARRIHECPICLEKFPHVLQLKSHVAVHATDGGRYTCPHCNKVFGKYGVVRKHIRAFHCERRHQCSHCPMRFPSLDKLRMHQLRHSDHKEFLCANCGKQFKRKDKLQEHCRRMHAPKEERERVLSKRKAAIMLKRQQRERERQRQRQRDGNLDVGVEITLVHKKARKESDKKAFVPKVSPTDYHRFIYKCHLCLVGFKRRGMLVNHLAKRHPEIPASTVPELNLPILRATRDYFCTHCDKVYRSSSKRKAHMVQKHPGAELPASSRRQRQLPATSAAVGGAAAAAATEAAAAGGVVICGVDPGGVGGADATFSQTVGSITTSPQSCQWCHKQYASKAKLLQHQRREHRDVLQEIVERKKFERLEKQHASKKHDAAAKYTNAFPQPSQRFTLNIKEHHIVQQQQQQITVDTLSYLTTDEMMIMQQQTDIVEDLIIPEQLDDINCHPQGDRSNREFGYQLESLEEVSNSNYNEASVNSAAFQQNGDVNRLMRILNTDNNLVPPR